MPTPEEEEQQTVPVGSAITSPITTTTEGGNEATSSSSRLGKDAVAAVDASEQAGLDAAEKAHEAGAADVTAKAATADVQDSLSDLSHQQSADRAAGDLERLDIIKRAQEAHDQDMTQARQAGYHKLFDNILTGKKLGMSAGMLLTGLSGNVEAQKLQFDDINNQITNDFNAQKAKHEEQLRVAAQSGQDVNSLYADWERSNAQLSAREAVARQAVLDKMQETAMRMGIPVASLQNDANFKAAQAAVIAKKADALKSNVNHFTVTKQLTPKVQTVEGKLQGGKGAGAAGKVVANLDQADIDELIKSTPSQRAVDTAKREASGDPSLLSRGAGLIKGEEPDYKVGLNDQDKNHADLVSRVLIPIAKLQNKSTRKPSKEELTAAAEAVIPNDRDTPEGKARKIANLQRLAATPGVVQGGRPGPSGGGAVRFVKTANGVQKFDATGARIQ